MFLVKLAIWAVMYPVTLALFAWTTIVSLLDFLFNSPVDIWNIITESVNEATKEK